MYYLAVYSLFIWQAPYTIFFSYDSSVYSRLLANVRRSCFRSKMPQRRPRGDCVPCVTLIIQEVTTVYHAYVQRAFATLRIYVQKPFLINSELIYRIPQILLFYNDQVVYNAYKRYLLISVKYKDVYQHLRRGEIDHCISRSKNTKLVTLAPYAHSHRKDS